jgi:hypothetical protein
MQCRYLKELGIDIRAKHAMYKREPYPMGESKTGTLMMNIISESRAAEYYRQLSHNTKEPRLKQIWKLIGQDEARHARAFFIFCKEMCDYDRKHIIEALRMAYIWLADRSKGLKHPAGFFFPHSTSTDGLRHVESNNISMTDSADSRILAMVRELAAEPSILTFQDVKRYLRENIS